VRFARLLPKGLYQNEFQLPGLTLANPTKIIDIAVSDVRMNSLHKAYAQEGAQVIRPESLEQALVVFNNITRGDNHVISIYQITDVMHELGLSLTAADIQEIITQLEVKDTMELSFAETVEIATFIHEQKQSAHHTGEENPFLD
jgi:Ca2+-binding EF-hand superfamily protein